MTMTDSDLDRPIWGAKAFAEVLNLWDSNGEPDAAAVFRLLGAKDGPRLPAKQVGRKWVSTPRQLLAAVTPTDGARRP